MFDSIKSFLTYYHKVLSQLAAPEEMAPAEDENQVAQEAVENHDGGHAQVEENAVGEHVQQDGHAQGGHRPPNGQIIAEGEPAEPIEALPPRPADADLTDEERAAKDQAVRDLVDSGSFASTHAAIGNLQRNFVEVLTGRDANLIAHGAIDNRQINWIINDHDVKTFYLNLLEKHILELEDDALDGLADLLDLNEDSTSEEDEVSSTGE